MLMHKTSGSLRKVLYVAVAVIGTAVILTMYINDRISLAEVIVDSGPVVAARDLPTLLKMQPDTGGRRIDGQMPHTAITANTKCRLLRYESKLWCLVGKSNPVKIELLEGSSRGQVVWMCSDQIRLLHPLP
jgi:hypothetical protein